MIGPISHIEPVLAVLKKHFGAPTRFGRSKRLFQFGTHYTCSINFSRELRGGKFFFGLSQEVLDPRADIPATTHGHFVLLVCGSDGSVLWLPRAEVLHAMRGVTTGKLDVFNEGGGYILQTTGHSKRDVTEYLNAVPEDCAANNTEAVAPEKSRVHSEMQVGLAKIGRAEGCNVWVPAGDRNVKFANESLRDLTCERLPNFGFDESTRRIVSNIDVLWLEKNVIRRAFEVEATTSIYSGLLRLNDLVLAQPNNRIELVIAADAARKKRVVGQMLRPTFGSLSGLCGFVSFDDIRAGVEQIETIQKKGATRVHGMLKAERLEPEDRATLNVADIRL